MIGVSGKRRILAKLDEMAVYLTELEDMLPEREVYFQDLIRRRACEKTAEVAIESLIDAAGMIVSYGRFGLPDSEGGIFDILVRQGVFDSSFGERLKDMKGFRNILIHRYGVVDDGLVYDNLSNYLDDFSHFKRSVIGYFKKRG